jgi:Penicillin-insensitive murein endopeptidase
MTRRRSGYLAGGWRTGEVWLEPSDLRWFGEVRRTVREAVAVPLQPLVVTAGASVVVPPVAAPRPLSSRRRRMATRLAPAVAAVAAVGIGTPLALDMRSAVTADVLPPSTTPVLTESAAPVLPPVREDTVPATGAPAAAATLPRASDGQATSASSFPAIHWRESQATGVPHDGRLVDGVRLPQEGPGWATWDPVLDRVPNRPNRLFGTDGLVRVTLDVIAAYRLAHPDAPQVLIGDLSRRGGGEIDEHASHENGLDIDVYYPRLDGHLRPPRDVSQVDLRLAQDLAGRFVAAGAQVIFVGTSVPIRGPDGIIVPYPNHNEHMHFRMTAFGGTSPVD